MLVDAEVVEAPHAKGFSLMPPAIADTNCSCHAAAVALLEATCDYM